MSIDETELIAQIKHGDFELCPVFHTNTPLFPILSVTFGLFGRKSKAKNLAYMSIILSSLYVLYFIGVVLLVRPLDLGYQTSNLEFSCN